MICLICHPRDKLDLLKTCAQNSEEVIILAASDAFVGWRFAGIIILPGVMEYVRSEMGDSRVPQWMDNILGHLGPGARITTLT